MALLGDLTMPQKDLYRQMAVTGMLTWVFVLAIR